MTQTIELNDFQQGALAVPEAVDLFVGGGRGGGKSFLLALLCLRHAEQYGAQSRMLYIRKSYRGLADFELVCRELFGKVYGTAATYNQANHVWRFPNGAYLELGQLETHADYGKFQGRSFGILLVDEAGQFNDPSLLDLLRSNLRGPTGMPIRMIVAANPGGAGHAWLAARYVFKAGPWRVFDEPKSKRQWCYAPSTFDGNRFIDREQYADQLRSACCDDPELLRAWMEGDWSINRGSYFASVLSEDRNAVDPWDCIPDGWNTWLTHDFGSAAPSATYIVAQSPGEEVNGVWYPRNSLVLIDELATNREGSLNVGLGWTVPVLADAIKAMCRRWDVPASGVCDDACFARTGSGAGSIAQEFAMAGVHFSPARKADRITGWNRMRRLLSFAGQVDRPGLYISRSCEYLWATLPSLPRDSKRIEDVDSTGPDHGADAVRYGCLRNQPAMNIHMDMAN